MPNEPTDADAASQTEQRPARPTYPDFEPRCPLCHCSNWESTSESIPSSFERHSVHATCAECGTHCRIEYRAIDVSWLDGVDETHSAVSQGLIDPSPEEYLDEGMFGPLPDQAALEGFDWPLECHCGEHLTGNHIYSLDENTADQTEVDDEADPSLSSQPEPPGRSPIDGMACRRLRYPVGN